jgi:hypothetical protein
MIKIYSNSSSGSTLWCCGFKEDTLGKWLVNTNPHNGLAPSGLSPCMTHNEKAASKLL